MIDGKNRVASICRRLLKSRTRLTRALLLSAAGFALTVTSPSVAAPPADGIANGGLLRNSDFQDDWTTHLPELKNHHWNYTTEVFNRRDYNPDGWWLNGSWDWLDADKPIGSRRLVLRGPNAVVTQTVPWVQVHNSKKRPVGWPDAGGYPPEESRRSKTPLAFVRDLTFRVRVSAKDVPENAGEIVVAFDKTLSATAPIPAGSYEGKIVEVVLKANDWLAKAKEDKQAEALGVELPSAASCVIRYKADKGEIQLVNASLTAPEPASANLVVNGGFEEVDSDGYAKGWSRPAKYIYFPPGIYYNFNTWHNTTADNRGPIALDSLVVASGTRSLKMIIAAGDEKYIASPPITLNQTEPALIEASVWVKTDRLSTIQFDAEDENGKRIDCYNTIQKYPVSIGTNDWRLIRQVFSPSAPLKSIRIRLAARGINGFTLDDTSDQPQNNVVGTVWWDELRVWEPERGSAVSRASDPAPGARLVSLNLGERFFGENELTATILSGTADGTFRLVFDFVSPTGVKSSFESKPVSIGKNASAEVKIPYTLTELCVNAYTEYHGKLTLLRNEKPYAATDVWFSTWTVPIDMELGSLYLLPDTNKQFVKLNLGLTYATIKNLKSVRLDVIRRESGKVVTTLEVPATLDALAAQRAKLPAETRDDFANELLADVDVSALPVQAFNDPQRNWIIRATAMDTGGKAVISTDSQPFCRLAHDPPQPAIQSVRIDKDGLLFINDKPWLAWGVTYGHNPVYAGPADPGPGKYHNLRNLSPWGLYDRHGGKLASRALYDGNCIRYVAGSITKIEGVNGGWNGDNVYASSVFVVPDPVWSLDDLAKHAGGKEKLDAYLAAVKTNPAIVSTAPGIEEAFGNFSNATAAELAGMEQVVNAIRTATGKPVMVGHGGYWNRYEFERVPYFDIYDPETEPLYPAHLHTDMRPLIEGKARVAWLRPQMYEDVPYERWRFHVFVEMMRGCRGWQLAHGPGDPTTYRGLHGEVEFMKPILYSKEATPKVTIAPLVENMVRKLGDKTYIVAATTHGTSAGTWRWSDEIVEAEGAPKIRVRVTERNHEWRDDANGYNVTGPAEEGPRAHGVQYLVHQRKWPVGSKLVQWVKFDEANVPKNLLAVVKADGRWTHAASWAGFDTPSLRSTPGKAHWFGRTFYRHITGVIGFGNAMTAPALELVPNASVDMGALPAAGKWVKFEVPLDKIGAIDKLIDGVGFVHEGGRVLWGQTSIVAPDGVEQVVMGEHLDRPSPEALSKTKFEVAGLKKGAKVRVVFEDREMTADEGFFTDDLRGRDLYQRFGGIDAGYGDAPVALRVYEIPRQ